MRVREEYKWREEVIRNKRCSFYSRYYLKKHSFASGMISGTDYTNGFYI